MQDIRLLPATAQDAERLCDVIHASFEAYRDVLVPPSGAHKETPETIADKLARGGGIMAYSGETLIGGVLYEPREGCMYVGRLAVLPEYRRAGLGRQLLAAVEGQARALGIPAMELGVRTQLPGNRAFFERQGYRVKRADAHPGFSEPTFYMMEKRLD
ncbi:MAG: GNAT family N-acetyltransferase [Anaerolineae bacterium]|nr:GNAT family N-acetyltransferase [Anaerolineae bacterium]